MIKHLDHDRSIQKHVVLFGGLYKCLLSSIGVYKDDNPLVLGKPLDIKCLGQASFKFDKKGEVWFKVQKFAAALVKEAEVLQLEGPDLETSSIDKVFVLLSNMIKDLSRNMNDHYLGMAKQMQKLDVKVDALEDQMKKAEDTAFIREKTLKDFHLNPMDLKIDELRESVASLRNDDDTEEVEEEEDEKS